MAGPIVISILTNASQTNAQLTKTATLTQRVGGGFRKMALPAVAGLGAIGFAAAGAVKSLARIERINTQTSTVIKSTGGAARVTAKHVESLTGNLENLTATEAESIQEGANVLLTFTNIRNGVGKTNKVFDQSVSVVTDMSRALGTDLKSQSIQVGKALNNPIKGISALSKVGVSFTDQQKAQITALTKSGKTMQAQKIILAELNKEFGGSGAAFAKTTEGKAALAGHQFGTLTETLTTQLLPAYAAVATKATQFAGVLIEHQHATKIVIIAVAALAAGVIAVNIAMKIAAATTAVYNGVMAVSATVSKAATAASLGTRLGLAALTVQTVATSAASKAAAAGQWLLNAALSANPIGLIVLAIVALVGGLVLAYKKSDTFRAIVNGAFAAVQTVISTAVGFIRKHLKTIGLVLLAMTGPVGIFVALFIKNFGRIKAAATGLVSGIKGAISGIVGIVRGVKDKVTGALSGAGKWLVNIGRSIVEGLVTGIKNSVHLVTDAIGNLKDKVVSGLKGALKINSPSKVVMPMGSSISEGLAVGIGDGERYVDRALTKISRHVSSSTIGSPDFSYGLNTKGKDSVGVLVGGGQGVPQVVNFNVKFDSHMTDAEIGVQMDKMLRAAQRAGMIR